MNLNDTIKLGVLLKKLRKEKDLTQEEFCNIVDFPQSTYANYESDKRMPNVDSLEKIANYYGMNSRQLINKAVSIEYAKEDVDDDVFKRLRLYCSLGGFSVDSKYINNEIVYVVYNKADNTSITLSKSKAKNIIEKLGLVLKSEFYSRAYAQMG